MRSINDPAIRRQIEQGIKALKSQLPLAMQQQLAISSTNQPMQQQQQPMMQQQQQPPPQQQHHQHQQQPQQYDGGGGGGFGSGGGFGGGGGGQSRMQQEQEEMRRAVQQQQRQKEQQQQEEEERIRNTPVPWTPSAEELAQRGGWDQMLRLVPDDPSALPMPPAHLNAAMPPAHLNTNTQARPTGGGVGPRAPAPAGPVDMWQQVRETRHCCLPACLPAFC